MGKITNRLVGRLYPKWLYTHRGRRLLRLPAAEVLAIEWFGLAPKKPWVLHSAPSDVIALESEAIRAYCQKEGLPSSRLKVVGSIHNDILFAGLMKKRRLRLALCHKLGFDARKPIILSALPPDFLYATGGRSECDFTDYRKLVEFWVKTLVGNATREVLISQHPSVKISDFKYIERWGVKISDQSIIELIPLCDIFVASISATIQWAIACGKPVINYDVYKYRYGDYDKTPGTITIEGKADFGKYLNKFIRDKKYLQRMTKRQAAVAAEWGRLDGKSGERILQLIDKLTIGADGR